MECGACGYVEGRSEKEEDNQPFIEIKGSFYIRTSGYYSHDEEVELYACPKCKTIKLDLMW